VNTAPVAQPELDEALRAVERGDAAALARLLDAAPSLLNARDGEGRTLLFEACHEATGHAAIPSVAGTAEQHAIVDGLLRRGADPSGWAEHSGAADSAALLRARL
jgi:hypothetical protein